MSATISPQSNGQLTGLWEALSTEMYKSETLQGAMSQGPDDVVLEMMQQKEEKFPFGCRKKGILVSIMRTGRDVSKEIQQRTTM